MVAHPGVPRAAAPGRVVLDEQLLRRIEQAAGVLATRSVARMDDELAWFRELPADQRSWVTLVAQAGLQSFVEWLRSPDDGLRLTGEVFRAAPQAMAHSVTLAQTVELVRQAIAVAEENLPAIAGAEEVETIRTELLRFSREIAFAAARVYATAAEHRGLWDRRLEALVIDSLVSGSSVSDSLSSRLAALGWQDTGPILSLAGPAPDRPRDEALEDVHTRARDAGLDVMAGVHADRLILVVGGTDDAAQLARALLDAFGAGPVVVGPVASGIKDAAHVVRAALSGLRAVAGWPGAPRPVDADALLPERALAGDADARAQLVHEVYEPLLDAGGGLMETVTAFLDAGAALEATARALFVHANTVRYRLRRVAELCGQTPTEPRGALTLRVALVLGRLDRAAASAGDTRDAP